MLSSIVAVLHVSFSWPWGAAAAESVRSGGTGCERGPVPLLFAMDADYDDMLALVYLAKHPMFGLRGIVVERTGFGTPHGGPTNTAALAAFLGQGHVPIAYGHMPSLSPVANFPTAWRVALDGVFESLYEVACEDCGNRTALEPVTPGISPLPAPRLISRVLSESECPVVVLTTAPVTSLAVALYEVDQAYQAAEKIRAVFMMGTAYGGENNVLDSELTFNGKAPGCTDSGGANYETLSSEGFKPRARCRGVNMTKNGDTEWNVFLDTLAWQRVYGALFASATRVYTFTSRAAWGAAFDQEENIAHAEALADPRLRAVMVQLVTSLGSTPGARWWDAAAAVVMAEVLAGADAEGAGVCADWARQRQAGVSLLWRSRPGPGQKNPYGSVADDPAAAAPLTDFCIRGRPGRMEDAYWPVVQGAQAGGNTSQT
eukprot:CAMPEP_0170237338 /NCGR_PEP_ID=MMETSP0116_2-20130129/18419_1 /TAXON_ID=400756 /ORGANISM="Durinskia baltica, Strain CSIRO CS-38" /LENGTH=429 /DNA_ID=CAMNT_0010488141 /DNA_START=105 /DNA_END=1394 /DNA_ORIENTATION=-